MRRWRIALFVLVGLALARYAAACFFIHPFGDDFSYAVAGMRHGFMGRLRDEYLLWNGRWASNPLVLRGPLVLGLERGLVLYRAVPVLLLGLAWLGWCSLSRAMLPGLSRGDATLAASLLLLTALQAMPDIGEGLYWYTGAVSYFIPASLTLFLLAGWIRAWRSGWGMSRLFLARQGVLAAVIAGFNETHMVLLVLLHALLLGWHRARQRAWHPGLAAVLLAVLGAGVIMALAPGNAVRAAQFPLRGDAFRSMAWGAAQTARFLVPWLLTLIVLLVAVFTSAPASWLRERAVWTMRISRPGALMLAAAIVLFVFAAMALPYWTTGLLGQHRTVNAAWLFVAPLMLLALLRFLLASSWLGASAVPGKVLWGLFFLGVFITGSGGRLSSDLLTGRFARFDAKVRSRYALIEAAKAKGEAALELPGLVDPPATAHYLDAGADPDGWINRSMAQFFGADALRISVQPPAR